MKKEIFLWLFALIFVAGCQNYYDPIFVSGKFPSRTNPILPDTFSIEIDGDDFFPVARLMTYYYGDWDEWELFMDGYKVATFQTSVSEDWDSWVFTFGDKTGRIMTCVSEDWDCWEIYADTNYYRLTTYVSEDWDRWELYDTALIMYAQTYVSDDFDRWELYYNDKKIYFQTTFSEGWDNWEFYSADSVLNDTLSMVTASFLAIFTASIYQQGILTKKNSR